MTGLDLGEQDVPQRVRYRRKLNVGFDRGEIQRGSGNGAAAGIRNVDYQVAGNRLAIDGRHTKNYSGQQLRGCFHDASPSPPNAHMAPGSDSLVDAIMLHPGSAMQYRTYP